MSYRSCPLRDKFALSSLLGGGTVSLDVVIVDDVEREARELAAMIAAAPLGRGLATRVCTSAPEFEELLHSGGGVA